MSRGLADTSVFIARESGRALDTEALPAELAVSIITIGELRAGVLAAGTVDVRDRRLATDRSARAGSGASGRVRRRRVGSPWIAATALALGVAVVTQDDDFPNVGDLTVTKV